MFQVTFKSRASGKKFKFRVSVPDFAAAKEYVKWQVRSWGRGLGEFQFYISRAK
jgi:hypothetical protein